MLVVYQDVINIVQAKFSSTEVVKCIHLNVSSVNESLDEVHKILALVECKSSYALFVFITKKPRPSSISDLTIETAIPINSCFSCDTEPIENCQSHIIFIVNFKSNKLQFKIEIGVESSNFASEVVWSKEVSNNPNFNWLDKYKCDNLDPSNQKTSEMTDQSSDIPVLRHQLAQGQAASNRESILRYQLKLKEPEYTQQQEFSIFVGTWNVNGQPPSVSLRPWLSFDEEPPDLYAIGLQEIDLSKEAFLFNDTPREAEWVKYVMDGVHSKAKYKSVAVTRLVGMQLIVLVNSKHYQFVKNVAVDTVGTGLLGKMGNKGGVAVRLELHNTSLCFVNCHLAAHIEEFERRNQDYKDINARINFRKQPQSIKDHEQVYWLGDLNYRITDLNTQQVKTLLARNEIVTLLKADQLNQQKDRGHVLLDYTEGDITFHPTYKYDLNTDTFDTSEKARPPAWTDRILWRGEGIYQTAYRSHMDVRISDHKPVSALFKSEISVIDQNKFRRVHEDLLKKMDKLENEFLPQVMVDQTEVVFDLVKFREPQAREIIIANTGQVPAEFEFIKKLDEATYCKDWLRITPFCGTIDPGDKCDIKFEVNLEREMDKVYDILVLHLKGGKDMFIIVTGECQRSCFTSSISTLCRAPVPLLQMSEEQRKQAENMESRVLYSIPRELWHLVDNLYRYGLKTRDLFESCALHEEIIRIRDWLDYGSVDSLPGTVQAVAEALLLFLSYTKDPIVPFELHDSCIAAANNFQNCRLIIQQKMSDVHRNVFLYICMFLKELLKYSNENGYDAKTLASLFGDILLRDPIRNSKPQANRGKANFVYNFLVNDLSSSIIPNK
ncbi:inositol polyphosphate 5-phosphatase OCRL [Tribolium castaneum]|uniref:phosphoinositide 5-phosphatase n=1 Tax=Tribolium castaneum TaxID=7070 RepID=D6X224_TRICA|nr:PREDICTED: inositol polyphosphate 5-phosphatase OCRL-1 [Tribolium castaneum]EFA09929.2 Inositol polyphosphate 5-phosphatase OCRL-1-like Protein [Tribolium castaneum]|eukprot:XP_015838767.1 PREDICTED: inositol polyphosphate 5-phosphatase OCRL-1 [Tribolium castaneum]